ncbi:double-stranded RNA-binding 4-like [Olea europaea subsp. europaea]|uniref:Double-stranded RNA-binding 4-like n=1 Tax=Olea europaea subsp. europaea TaxID=158383 RepID=A0A8S0R1B8_OLEEU|nr:double-stranded RNA-binding 4-like [Olea europaea subsp. europaea]
MKVLKLFTTYSLNANLTSNLRPILGAIVGMRWWRSILNHKNGLQEYLQRKLLPLPTYETEKVSTNPILFKSKVHVNGKVFETMNVYRRKKIAEQVVAKLALNTLQEGDDDKEDEIIELATLKIGD